MLNPPQKYEVLPACKTLLDNSSLAADLIINGHVVVTEGNVLSFPEPTPASDGSWWRVVLMPTINGLAEQDEHLDKVTGFKFRVRCDFNPPQIDSDQTYDDIGLNLEAFLEGAHQKVYKVLHRQSLTLTKADQVYNIIRKKPPGSMFREPDKGYRYMMAPYLQILGPTN